MVGRDARGSLHGCVGGCGMWLYSIVDPMAGPALAPITTMIYVGCGWKATRGLVQRCVVRIWIFASHDRPSDGGAQAGMGKSNGFLMVAIGTEAVGVNIDV